MLGAFKTATLRGVASTAPYGHGGSFTTLLEVSQHYGKRASDVGDDKATGAIEAWVPQFDTNAQGQLPALLEILTADPLP
jgi:cytochrome c peroxidase